MPHLFAWVSENNGELFLVKMGQKPMSGCGHEKDTPSLFAWVSKNNGEIFRDRWDGNLCRAAVSRRIPPPDPCFHCTTLTLTRRKQRWKLHLAPLHSTNKSVPGGDQAHAECRVATKDMRNLAAHRTAYFRETTRKDETTPARTPYSLFAMRYWVRYGIRY